MWIKLCLLLLYICLLFILSRLLETFSFGNLDSESERVLSGHLLDPMRLSVAKLKCVLDHRGVSYDGIVEKSELTRLVETSGPVNVADVDMPCQEESVLSETNFTSGAHFIEQVEDAKDSVWLVQVVTQTEQAKLVVNRRWRNIQRKASHFGVRTGLLDCSLDVRYCYRKGWKMPGMLLALPRVFEKKANVIMYNYSGPATESAVMRWMHDKLDAKVMRIEDMAQLQKPSSYSFKDLSPEVHAVLFAQAVTAPLFFSALSVKFPGRVKFGLVSVNDNSATKKSFLEKLTKRFNHMQLPVFIVYTAEGEYTYGYRPSEKFSFSNMEIFLQFLYPCLNDIFIVSFCIANVISWFEFFVSNCGIFKRIRKLIWCVLKYNIMVIMLWLPTIGIFQMPYLDQVPLICLKMHRIFTTSDIGAVLRGDYVFFVSNPIYVYLSFVAYLVSVTLLCKKYREVEDDADDWFNFRHMQSFTHFGGSNNLFQPMRVSSYDLVGGMEVFGSRFSQHSLWLQPSIPMEYIQHLPTWRYSPLTLAQRAAQNVLRIESAMAIADQKMSSEKITCECKKNQELNNTNTSTKKSSDCCCCPKSKSSNLTESNLTTAKEEKSCSGLVSTNAMTTSSQNGCDYNIHFSPARLDLSRENSSQVCSSTATTDLGASSTSSNTGHVNTQPLHTTFKTHHHHRNHPNQENGNSSMTTPTHSNPHPFNPATATNANSSTTTTTTVPQQESNSNSKRGCNCKCDSSGLLNNQNPTNPTHNSPLSVSQDQRDNDKVTKAPLPHSCKSLAAVSVSTVSSLKPTTPSSTSPYPPITLPPSTTPTPTIIHTDSTPPPPQLSLPPMQPGHILPNGFRRGFTETTQCVICLEEYVPLTMLCGLPCGHVFHESCIISWLNREKHFCPMCRWPSYKLVPSSDPS